jgi:hypothetical protein
MKLYIAGKISGEPNYKNKFARVGEKLEQAGHWVMNPASLPPGARLEVSYAEKSGKQVFCDFGLLTGGLRA